MVDNMVQEGDEDAALVTDFESAAADLLQSDEELASAYTAYADARRRLNEKVRAVRESQRVPTKVSKENSPRDMDLRENRCSNAYLSLVVACVERWDTGRQNVHPGLTLPATPPTVLLRHQPRLCKACPWR